MYDEIRDELKEKQEELFSWKAQLEISLAEAPKGKLYRSASNGYEQVLHTRAGSQWKNPKKICKKERAKTVSEDLAKGL